MKDPEDLEEPTLPEKRVTMRDVAEYVTAQIKASEDRVLVQVAALVSKATARTNWIFVGLVAQYQLHLDLSAISILGGVFVSYLALARFVPGLFGR